MVAIPKEDTQPTIAAIYKHYEDSQEDSRGHLGFSQIGHECERMLWYSFRWVRKPSFPGRILRLFMRGQNEEKTFEDELRAIGVDIQTIDSDTGKQFRVYAVGGHCAGSLDGKGIGFLEAPHTEHVAEFKTHSHKSFVDLQKNGVQKSKPKHYAQMQGYMRLSGLTRAFYLAVDKDNDELYSERIRLDTTFADDLIAKAKRIIEAPEPPERISADPSFYKCKWCDNYEHCHQLDDLHLFVRANCRTCAHATPDTSGSNADWRCSRHGNDIIPFDFQRTGCDAHVFIPTLVNADLVDANQEENWCEYRLPDGRTFRNGTGHHASKELAAAGIAIIGEDFQQLKTAFDGEWISSSKVSEVTA